MTKYILYFEPEDIEADTREEARINYRLSFKRPSISKILPLDGDGFVIEQPKHVE